ncbi:uncharacterized protein LOC124493320 [Dermatophagoides farinae]|uniref:Uncharacterized protein n=2 Tax=Dermatophagoides farinae TaxID=6954 RepID=A0A9D4SJN6_DERFA|nr:uncharacterized protein LOC124493320 [Dermatophagoides farinae]KAH7644407.1 hypothetical protein HUG17_6769 [Dermatophagoides farinae]
MGKTEETSFDNNNNNNNDTDINKKNVTLPEKSESPPTTKTNKDGALKRKWKRVLRTRPHLFIIFIISVIGFCYHFNIALNQYWDYKTTVSFSNEDPKDYKFHYPSATVCFQDVVPYFKLFEKFPEYEENVNRIYGEMKRRNNSNFWNNPATKKLINVTGVNLEALHLHKYFEEKIFRREKLIDILEKYSHSEHEECLLDSKPASKYGYKLHNCENVTRIIQTINGEFRCFTYFSHFDVKENEMSEYFDDNFMTSIFISSKTFERRTNKVYYISHALNHSRSSHPFEKELRARIAIHPSDMIPVPEFYPTISLYQFSRFYVINFQKTISYLLEKPYITNCFKYDLGNREALQSHDDCFTKCVMNKYREKCKCLPRSGLLYRRSLLTDEDYFCPVINKCQFTNYRTECSNECQPDCVEEKYEFEKFVDIPFYQHKNRTGIQISRKPVFDKVYRHSPAMTFIQLICDFGGLGGLWLGFSVISITAAIISLITKPLEKIVVVKNGDKE